MKRFFTFILLSFWTVGSLFAQNNSEFISQLVPQTVTPGGKYNISVTFKNTGTTTWKSSTLYRLGTQDPQDNTIWIKTTRVSLPNDVSPGQEVTFKIAITAPAKEGIYSLRWRMVQDGVAWFGKYSDPIYFPILISASDSLLAESFQFKVTNRTVSTLMFCWYGPGEWQVNGPWIPWMAGNRGMVQLASGNK